MYLKLHEMNKFWHELSIAFYLTGILPVISITPDPTGIVYEPGRELIIMCEASDTFGGSVEWTSQGDPVLSIGTWSDVSLVHKAIQLLLECTRHEFACKCIYHEGSNCIVNCVMLYGIGVWDECLIPL